MSHVAPGFVSEARADERSKIMAKRFEVPVLVAAALALPVIVVEQSAASDAVKNVAGTLNWLIWLVFLVELVAMLAVVPHRWDWLRRHPVGLAIVVLTPPFLPASLQALRIFRLLQLLPLLRLATLGRRTFSLDGLRYAALLALLTALGGGAAFAAAEGGDVSTWDGLWWSVTTMTTVGYGDVVPQTDLGRVIAMGAMLVGIAFIAVLTAALAGQLLRHGVTRETAIVTQDVEDAEAAVLTELREITQRLTALEEQFGAHEGRNA
jgi:voltage-gated potassium channel